MEHVVGSLGPALGAIGPTLGPLGTALGHHDDAQHEYNAIYHSEMLPHHKASITHEAIAGAVGFAAMHAYESHLRSTGKEPSHALVKEILAGIAAAEVDKLIETKGLDMIDRTKQRRWPQSAHRSLRNTATREASGGSMHGREVGMRRSTTTPVDLPGESIPLMLAFRCIRPEGIQLQDTTLRLLVGTIILLKDIRRRWDMGYPWRAARRNTFYAIMGIFAVIATVAIVIELHHVPKSEDVVLLTFDFVYI